MPSNETPSFVSRLYAVLIDYCIILAYMGCLAAVALGVNLLTGQLPSWLDYGVTAAEVLGFVLLVLPVGLYLYASEASVHRATVGKRALHLTVSTNAGQRLPSRRQIAVRTIIKLVPWEVAHFFMWHAVAAARNGQSSLPLWLEVGLVGCLVLPVAYILVVALEPRGRGPHDLAAGTRVVITAR